MTAARPPHTMAALSAAALIGAVYSFSPLTVIVVVAMAALFGAAVRGVSGRERQWVLGSLGSALALRLVLLAGIYVTTAPSTENFNALFGDGRFSIQRSIWMLNEWQSVPIAPFLDFFHDYGQVGYDRALAVVQWFVGESPYGLPLLSVGAFFSGAVLLYRLARPTFGPTAATAGLVALVFWPTFVAWSISMLKESIVLLLSAIAVVAAVRAARVQARGTRVALAVVGAVAVLLMNPVRSGSHLIAVMAIVLGYAVSQSVRHVVVMAVLVSAAAGVVGFVAMRRPAIVARVQSEVASAQHYHVGHVASVGKSYRAADQRFYDAWPDSPPATVDECARYLLRSAAMFVFVPLPSHIVSASEALFLPEHFTWYLLILLACAGIVFGLRRDALLTGTCAGYCVAGLAIIAPYSGNIGTLIRHRDMIVPFMVWLSGVGAVGLLGALPARSHAAR